MQRLPAPIRRMVDRVQSRASIHERILYWAYGPQFRNWCDSNPCECAVDRWELYRSLVEREGLDGPIDYLEFGVAAGASIRWWVENSPHWESTFVGFDSFAGLPEDWLNRPRGSFSTNGESPAITDPRCSFVKGLIQDTLPEWLTGREFRRRTVLHIDVDLYSSTLVVLTQLLPKLKVSDIIIFDEFGVELHEYRAFVDATTAYPLRFAPLYRTANFDRVALKVI